MAPDGDPDDRPAGRRVGVDTGGTFTDVVAGGRHGRQGAVDAGRPGRPRWPTGSRRVGGADVLAHGTTVATNALLERRGGRVALITTEGHADVIEIARQARPSLYDLWADRPEPLVPRELRFEVRRPAGRRGQRADAARLGARPAATALDAVAVCLLHADRNPAPRAGAGRRAAAAGVDVVVLVRGVPRVPRVRAHGDHRGQRLPAPAVPGLPAAPGRAGRARCWS